MTLYFPLPPLFPAHAHSADVVQAANSGHPGAPMGMAPMAHVLFSHTMNFSPSNPAWLNRDRFVLSNGHACALLYTMLHLTGYSAFTIDEIKNFRQLGSVTPGHPERAHGGTIDGIEVTTGPLGQGLSNAVGIAMAQAHLQATWFGHSSNSSIEKVENFNGLDHYTYVFVGDGCLQEGIASEAASLAGHLKLGRLIVLYDDNQITIDGSTTDLSFSEDVLKRFEAYGWHTQTVADADTNVDGIKSSIDKARAVLDRPSIIACKTTIGKGSAKQGTQKVHGSPLGAEDLANVKTLYGMDPTQSYHVDDDVRKVYTDSAKRGEAAWNSWNQGYQAWAKAFPDRAAAFELACQDPSSAGNSKNAVNAAVEAYLQEEACTQKAKKATRQWSQMFIQHLAKAVPGLIGGSADLTPSTLTYIQSSVDFQAATPHGRNVRYGVREHAMAGVCNGMAAYHGKTSALVRPFCATFLNFLGYCLGSVTLSALSKLGVVYVFTHDSIGLGEDGPTHQPVEKYMMCRATPDLFFVRPGDAREVAGAYKLSMDYPDTPVVIALTRQGVPWIKGTRVDGVAKGAYVVENSENSENLNEKKSPRLVLVATGSELGLAHEAFEALRAEVSVSVVSMPCWETFAMQPKSYQQEVFPEGAVVLSVEAGVGQGWERYSHASICMTSFGASAPAGDLFEKFGFTVKNVCEKGKALLEFYKDKPVPSLDRPW